MGLLKIEGVTHWSIPVNDLEESIKFYGDLLGLTLVGRLGDSGMACFNIGDHNILLCQGKQSGEKNELVHHSFTVSPETLTQACKIFHDKKVPIIELYYRPKGYFTGRESNGKFVSGAQIVHEKFGYGKILRVQDTGDDLKITVQFPGLGIKRLLQSYAKLKLV